MLPKIRLVTFDALHTLVTPRAPIHVLYSNAFEPYLGSIDPESVKKNFKIALKEMQTYNPLYKGGVDPWWYEIIRRTALGAGAEPQAVEKHLSQIVPRLLQVFSSKEGYKPFHDTIPVLEELRRMKVKMAVISNTDSRMGAVLEDLELKSFMDTILLSEEIGIAKPSAEIFEQALQQVSLSTSESQSLTPSACLHIGDELESDYYGATNAGFQALLLRRDGEDDDEGAEDLSGVDTVKDLYGALPWVRKRK